MKGRRILATRIGPADADKVLLVLGQMHGDEPYGRYVVDRLRRMRALKGTAVWTIRTMNPDGARARTRRNARMVDLNRNFPQGWAPGVLGSLYYSGPRPASEPETRALVSFVQAISPDAIVSFHQRLNVIDRGARDTRWKTAKWARRLSRDLDLRQAEVSCVIACAGTLTGWFNRTFPGWALTVELPRSIPVARQQSMARALVRLADDL